MQFGTGGEKIYTSLNSRNYTIWKLFFTEIKIDMVYYLLSKATVLNFYYMEFQIFQKFQYLIYSSRIFKSLSSY